MNDGMYSSNKGNWGTPDDFFNKLNAQYGFDLDPCADDINHKCENYFTEESNGLEQDWNGKVFMNPPYGRKIGLWIQKAYDETQNGNASFVVCLLPARTDTKWFHEICTLGEIIFIKGRLKFQGAKDAAPFPSMLVIFRQEPTAFPVNTMNR
jgi:phage N-6-adenine-methyltransferase